MVLNIFVYNPFPSIKAIVSFLEIWNEIIGLLVLSVYVKNTDCEFYKAVPPAIADNFTTTFQMRIYF